MLFALFRRYLITLTLLSVVGVNTHAALPLKNFKNPQEISSNKVNTSTPLSLKQKLRLLEQKQNGQTEHFI